MNQWTIKNKISGVITENSGEMRVQKIEEEEKLKDRRK